MKILVIFFFLVCFVGELFAQNSTVPNIVPDTMWIGGIGKTMESGFLYAPNGAIKGKSLSTYMKNIGGDSLIDAHITVGGYILDTQFKVQHNYRYKFSCYYPGKMESSVRDSTYTVGVAFPGTTGTPFNYVFHGNLILNPYHYSIFVPTGLDSSKLVVWDSIATRVENNITNTPTQFLLHQNYPNPFNPATTISFDIPSRSFVTLKIFDVIGREVATVVSEELSPGAYFRKWNAINLTCGIYIYCLQAGSFSEMKKLIVLK
ncbi:MAG: T9SS type A sorting domain-containing protein [Ignavibacteriaceae bacterium]|jgi:hypothetical protein